MAERGTVLGAILAGGRSRRFGRPKHALPLPGGGTMVEAVADALAAACPEIVVVGPEDVLPALAHVRETSPGAGPLAALDALLGSGLAETYLVCPCDQPRLAPDLLVALRDAPPAPLAALRLDGSEAPEPLPLRVAVGAIAMVRHVLDDGRASLRGLLEASPPVEVRVPARRRSALVNVNTPADHEALVQSLTPPRS